MSLPERFRLTALAATAVGLALPRTAPAIPLVQSAIRSDTTFTVAGAGFGTKNSPGPIKFDDFEDGTNGGALQARDSAWHVYASVGLNYSGELSHSGALSVGSPITNGESFHSNWYTYSPPSKAMFISYWWRTNHADTADHTIIKMTRINSSEAAGGGGHYNGAGGTTLGGTYDLARHGGPYCAYHNGVTGEVILKYFAEPPMNAWMRVDMYKQLSTPGVHDGVMAVDIVGVDKAIDTAALTRDTGYSFLLNTVLLGTMDGNDQNHDYEMYLDDMYIDSTQARVEIGNARSWDKCTHREIQVAKQWSDNQVVCRWNRGSFGATDSVFAYVVDAAGHRNAEGIPIAQANPNAVLPRSSNHLRLGSLRNRPSGSELTIELPTAAHLSVALHDLSGAQLSHRDFGPLEPGTHSWNLPRITGPCIAQFLRDGVRSSQLLVPGN